MSEGVVTRELPFDVGDRFSYSKLVEGQRVIAAGEVGGRGLGKQRERAGAFAAEIAERTPAVAASSAAKFASGAPAI